MGTYILFLISTFALLTWLLLGISKEKKVMMAALFWLMLVGTLALVDFFQNKDSIPPRFLLVILGNVIFIWYLFRLLKKKVIPIKHLMLIHVIRIPVEIFLYLLFEDKQVPKMMTFTGLNFDILMGISALIILFFMHFFRWEMSKNLLLIWNGIGILFLLNIVTIGILSSPLPFQLLFFEQPNIAVLSFPYVYLPSFIVPIVFLSHIIMIYQHFQRPSKR